MHNKVFIVGPTGSGKSKAALTLAQEFDGAIICADSQTVRKGLDIGTAKPTKQDQNLVPHYLLDQVEPYERYSVARFKREATKAIENITKQGKLPIVVGGTGLYIDALFFNYSLKTSKDENRRQKYESLSVESLQEIVRANNWEMPKNTLNPRHLIGVIMRQGKKFSDREPVADAVIYGILPSDDVLRRRIDRRVEAMFEDGLIMEVQRIVNVYGKPPEKLDAIGYPIVYTYIQGDNTLEKTKAQLKQAHWQYARKQKMWFKRNKSIQWFSSADSLVVEARKQLASHCTILLQ